MYSEYQNWCLKSDIDIYIKWNCAFTVANNKIAAGQGSLWAKQIIIEYEGKMG